MRLILAIAALWLFGTSSALAQSEDWLVLPVADTEDSPWMETVVAEVSRELRWQGIGVWSSGQAVSAFEQRGSAAPPELTESKVKALEMRSEAAVRQLALGEYQRALKELDAAQALSTPVLVALNRDPERARTVLDTCLYRVRALLETGDGAGAKAQAIDCVRMVPNTDPTPYMHPPKVADLYAEALRPGPEARGSLLVESEPASCGVRVNGVLLGRTPLEMKGLYPGETRVQVECEPEARGRVHPVSLSRGRSTLFVVNRFDRAIRTAPVVHLQYAEPGTQAQRARDARELARALPAAAVVLASAPAETVLELRLISGTRQNTAFARVAAKNGVVEPSDVRKGVATLLAGECRDVTGDAPVRLDCATGELLSDERTREREAQRRPPAGQFVAGLSLASVGTASLLAGYGLLIKRATAGGDWVDDPGTLDAQTKWLNLGTGVIVAGSAGSALLITAMPLALPYKRKTPWWAWLSGGAGLGFAASALALALTADPKPASPCSVNNLDPAPCVDRAKRTDLALMLGVTAAPLLTIPLVYLLRKGEKKLRADLSPGVHAHRNGGAITLGGIF